MKGKINSLKVITLALICAIIVNLLVVRATTTSINTEKIDKELLEIIDSAKATDTFPVAIWFNEIDAQEIESDVKAVININRETISDSYSTSSESKATSKRYTNADVDKYIETERALYSKAQTESHNTFIEKYDWLQTNKKGSDEKKIVFVSKYAPMMLAELTSNEILTLSKDTNVAKLYNCPDSKDINLSTLSNLVTDANYVRDTKGYSGDGIKIGMIELNVPNLNSPYLSGQNIVCNPDTTTSDEHATFDALILVGNSTIFNGVTYQGIVPDATLYATGYNGYTVDWYNKVEWLLSRGVHIITMSAGGERPEANYCTEERWLDHLAINHSVHFTVAAGNKDPDDDNSTLNIFIPALAYNVITVGNLDANNTVSFNDDELYWNSSYIENEGTNKPDLVAPATNMRYGNINNLNNVYAITGTSFAAPQVAGIIAQLCQQQPSLKVKQDAMKAILTASIEHNIHSYTPSDSEYDEYGAGVVNSAAAVYAVNNSLYCSSNFAANTPQATYHYYDLNVTANVKTRVSLTWLKYIKLSGEHSTITNPTDTTLANLSLSIWDPNGNFVVLSAEANNNTEIVEFTPSMTGTYKIAVTTANTSNQKTYYALAWKNYS